MGSSGLTIGVVAPAKAISQETAEKVTRFAREHYGSEIELRFHPQCFLTHGHFAGNDEARSLAFLEYANSPDIDVIWARAARDAWPRSGRSLDFRLVTITMSSSKFRPSWRS